MNSKDCGATSAEKRLQKSCRQILQELRNTTMQRKRLFLFLIIIETCQLNKINPYHYLIAVQTHKDLVQKTPSSWLPWNYTTTLSGLDPLGDGMPSQFTQGISPAIMVSSLSPA